MTQRSQTRAHAGASAIFLTLFAVVWNAMVFGLLVPERGASIWFKAVFVLMGVLVAWGSVFLWRQRIKGGSASLRLPVDPIPHGVPVAVGFQIARPVQASDWRVEAAIAWRDLQNSSFGTIWEQDFPACCRDGQRVQAEVCFPIDCPSCEPSQKGVEYHATLTLNANGVKWVFNVYTRAADSAESRRTLIGTDTLGNRRPAPSAAASRRASWVVGIVAVVVMLLQLPSYLDIDVWSPVKAWLGLARH